VSTPTPHRFIDPIWQIRDVLGWLIDRDPTQFGRIVTRDDLWAATLYNNRARKDDNRAVTSPSPRNRSPMRYRPLRMRVKEAIAHIAAATTGGDFAAAREEFLSAARDGALDVDAKTSLFTHERALMPREIWWNCQYLELPDPMASGFFFGAGKRWYELEVKRSDVEALWPGNQAPRRDAVTLLSPGPKGGEKKAASVAWEIAEKILEDEGGRPPRGHGRLTALARAVQPLLMERGHTREVDTITKYIRAEVCKWQMDNPTK
jgi:hypothetical protein